MLVGVLLGLTNFFTFAWARPWGVAGGLRNWGDNFFSMIGLYQGESISVFLSTNSVLVFGLLWGAFISALLAKEFAFRLSPPFELFKGLLGGVFMGIGAAMAGGCNIGGFYSAISALSLSGFTMMIGLFLGAFLGLKYLYWELNRIPPSQKKASEKQTSFNLNKFAPFFGLVFFISALISAFIYSQMAYSRIGILLLCGLVFGIILHRSRFCFARCFRDPMMTGDASVSKAAILSILIGTIGFAALKWAGIRAEGVYVNEAFWFGSLVGGVIFGFGMIIAGGCGSGSLWRAGEGHLKLIIAVISFSLATSLFKKWLTSSEALDQFMGFSVFLPDHLTYPGAIAFTIIILLAIYLFVAWNERSEKIVIEF